MPFNEPRNVPIEVLTPEVITILETWLGKMNKKHSLHLFLSMRLAPIYEDNKQADKAIAILETAKAQGHAVFKEKIYFDLGRMYASAKNNEKAKSNFSNYNTSQTL